MIPGVVDSPLEGSLLHGVDRSREPPKLLSPPQPAGHSRSHARPTASGPAARFSHVCLRRHPGDVHVTAYGSHQCSAPAVECYLTSVARNKYGTDVPANLLGGHDEVPRMISPKSTPHPRRRCRRCIVLSRALPYFRSVPSSGRPSTLAWNSPLFDI